MGTILLSILTAAIGGLIGTYYGAKFINIFQDRKFQKVRDIAIKALNIFKSYDNQSYTTAANEFNNRINLSEKQIILVALHKIGVPIDLSPDGLFNIKAVTFRNQLINKQEIEEMILQVKNNYCDNMFFQDVERYFMANSRIYALRATGKRFIEDVLAYSISKEKITHYPNYWWKNFSDGELRNLLVLMKHLNEEWNFDVNGKPKADVIKNMIRDVDRGLYDTYLLWDYEAYNNLVSQNSATAIMMKQFMSNN